MIITFKKQKGFKMTQMLDSRTLNYYTPIVKMFKNLKKKKKDRHNEETNEESKLRSEYYKWE